MGPDQGLPTRAGPEVQLLLACARCEAGPTVSAWLASLVSDGIDWDLLVRTARRHALLPLLYRRLITTCPGAVPEGVLVHLRECSRQNARRSLLVTRELCRITRLLESNGIPAVPFKGPALASQVHGDVALRQAGDLDVLIHRHDLPRAAALLASLGYEPRPRLDTTVEAALERLDASEYSFRTADGKPPLEIRWSLRWACLPFSLDSQQLWERVQWKSLGGQAIRALSPEDLLLVLCLHGTGHAWQTLRWLCDIAELIRTEPTLHWGVVIDRARAIGAHRALLLCLYLTRNLLAAPLPRPLPERLQADREVERIVARVSDRLLQDTDWQPSFFWFSPVHLSLIEGLRDRAHYCLQWAFAPTVRDWTFIPLPPLLFPLYHVLRPIRLLIKHSLGSLGRPASSAGTVRRTRASEVDPAQSRRRPSG